MKTNNLGYSFNLIDSEWIRAVRLEDGQPTLIGLGRALTQAHRVREIHGDTPPETAAIHRLLLTILYRVFRPEEEWGDLWRAGRLDSQRIEAYLYDAAWRDRFDLFDDEHPFFQAGINSPVWSSKYKTAPVMDLCLPFANDAAAVLFNHRSDDFTLTPAQAARALITSQAFGLGGLCDPAAPTKEEVSFSNAPCARGVIFLMEGENLFQTLLLNFFPVHLEEDYRLPRKIHDRPAWEMENPYADDPQRPYGFLDYSTWLNRRVLLLPEGDPGSPLVRSMRYYVGMKRMLGEPLNPLMNHNVNQALSKKSGGDTVYSPIVFRTDRSLWRDSAALYAWAEEKSRGQIPPRAFTWVGSELMAEGWLKKDERFFLSAYGICSSSGKQKMYGFRAERFPLPSAYLHEAGLDAAKRLKSALTRAEETARILSPAGALGQFANKLLSAGEKSADPNQVRNLLDGMGAESYFWSRLEPSFARLVEDLPNEPERAVQAWDEELCGLVRQAFEQAVQMVGEARAFSAYGQTAGIFEWQLKCVFDSDEVKAARREQQATRKAKKT